MYQLKITIDKISLPVWSRLQMRGTSTLNQLHHAIQIAFGWTNSHLYLFRDKVGRIGDLILWAESGDLEIISDKAVMITDKLKNPDDRMIYEYDMGNSWRHTVVLEGIDLKNSPHAVCTDGSRAAPPEDCGGIPG